MRVSELPRAGETCHGHDFKQLAGGKGANQAVACQRLGGKTSMIGAIGKSDSGPTSRTQLAAIGIDVSGVHEHADLCTGSAMIFVDDRGQNCIGVAAGANGSVSPEQVRAQTQCLQQASTLLMQLEVPLESVHTAAEIASQAGTRVVLNPAPATQPLPSDLLRLVNILIPNETEAACLSGLPVDDVEEAKTAAQTLRNAGVDTVIITMGAAGAVVADASGVISVPCEPTAVVDTVAAGDTFTGAIVVALEEGKTLEAAVKFANRAAGITIGRHGAVDAIPLRSEVDALSVPA